MKEGYLLDIQKSLGKDPHIDLFLKNEEGLEIVEDKDYKQEFWIKPVGNRSLKTLKNEIEEYTDLNPKEVTKWYRGGKPSLLEFSVAPNKRSRVIDEIDLVPIEKEFIGVNPNRSFEKDYLIKQKLRPLNYVKVEDDGVKADWNKPLFKPKLGFMDIEVYNKGKMPNPKDPEMPILSISYIAHNTSSGKRTARTLTHTHKSDLEFVETLPSEEDMLLRFVDLLLEEDSDFEFGFNSDAFDWKYIINRSEKLGIEDKLNLGRDGTKIKRIGGGLDRIPHMNGKVNIDLFQFLPRLYDFPGNKQSEMVKSILKKEKKEIGKEIYRYWETPELRDEFYSYAIEDVEDLEKLSLDLDIPEIILYGSLFTGVRPEYLTRKSSWDIVDELAQRKAYENSSGDNSVLTQSRGRNKKVDLIEEFSKNKKIGRFEHSNIYSLGDVHLKTISKLKDKLRGPFRGPVSWTAKTLEGKLKKWYTRGSWKKFLEFLALGTPHTLLSENYNWHSGSEDKLAKEYIKAFESELENIDRESAIYMDSKKLYTTSKENLREEAKDVPLIITDDKDILYLKDDMIYPKGIDIVNRNYPDKVNEINKKSCETLLLNGPGEGLEVTKKMLEELDNLSKEELKFTGILSRKPEKYKRDVDKVKVGRRLEKGENETVEYLFENGEPIPFDFIKEVDLKPIKEKIIRVLERVYSPFYGDFSSKIYE